MDDALAAHANDADIDITRMAKNMKSAQNAAVRNWLESRGHKGMHHAKGRRRQGRQLLRAPSRRKLCVLEAVYKRSWLAYRTDRAILALRLSSHAE